MDIANIYVDIIHMLKSIPTKPTEWKYKHPSRTTQHPELFQLYIHYGSLDIKATGLVLNLEDEH